MTTILTTRPAGAADPLVARLSALGYRVAAVPTVVLEPVAAGGPLDAALARLAELDLIVVTSPAGADAVLGALRRMGGLPDAPPHRRTATQGAVPCRWAAVGPGTAAVLEAAGIVVDVVAAQPSGRGLAATIAAALGSPTGLRILLARTDAADRDLPDALRAVGAVVEEVVAYRTHEAPDGARDPLRAALSDPDTRALVAASGSAIRGAHALLDDAGRDRLARLPIVSIGPTTSAAIHTLGLTVAAEATAPTLDGLVAAVAAVAPPPRPLRSES